MNPLNRPIFFLLVMLTSIQADVAAQSSSAEKHVLNARVKGLHSNVIYLERIYGHKEFIVDSAHVTGNGEFTFRFPAGKKGLYRVILGHSSREAFYSEPPRSFTFIVSDPETELYTVFESPSDSMIVTKGSENELFYEYQRSKKEAGVKMQLLENILELYPDDCKTPEAHRKGKNGCFYSKLEEQFNAVQQSTFEATNALIKNNAGSFLAAAVKTEQHPFADARLPKEKRLELLRENFFKASDFGDTTILFSDVLSRKIISFLGLFRNQAFTEKEQTDSFMRATDQLLTEARNGNSQIYKFILNYLIEGYNQIKQEELVAYIQSNYISGNSCEIEDERVKEILSSTFDYKRTAIGAVAPGIAFNAGVKFQGNETSKHALSETDVQSGKSSALADIKATFTVVFFWASWCPHCSRSLPELQSLYNQFKGSGSDRFLEVVGVSLDTDSASWINTLKSGNHDWINYCEFKKWESQAAKAYNIKATPTFFLLDKNKKIIAQTENIAQIQAFLTAN